LRREASQGALLIRQRDGTIRAFDKMDVMGQVYLARLDAALGRAARRSEVMDALERATLESRRAVEEMSSGGFTADPAPREATESVEDLSEQSRKP
jgi:ABC-type uncharacterized transport system YnjBCD ATPase subunit